MNSNTEQPKLITKLQFVDLDGTLITSDCLWETFLLFLKKNPFNGLIAIWWLISGGKAHLKHSIAKNVTLQPSLLPYNQDVIEFIKVQKSLGATIVLATATNKSIANQIAEHIGLFDDVIASDETTNVRGSTKKELLTTYANGQEYVYYGNSTVDLPVWSGCNHAIVVSSSQNLVQKASLDGKEIYHIPINSSFFPALVKQMRIYQWVKNSLIFIPLFLAHKVSIDLWIDGLLAFFAFGFAASSVYVVNDLLDLESDRQHHRKKNRPFASGVLSIPFGIALFPLLLVIAFSISAVLLPPLFTLFLGIYLVITTLYSFVLKKIVMIDVLTLSWLYTHRVFAGAVATDTPISPWLLLFAIFLFLSLAFVKRYSELLVAVEQNKTKASGRGYFTSDSPLIASVGPVSGYLGVFVFFLYINSPEVVALYSFPMLLWLVGPLLLYWISRIWVITIRGNMHDDPIVFTMKDPVSYFIGFCTFLIVTLASILPKLTFFTR
ncbi:MAG: UbiA family prenyltransferase [Candidatus Kapabacteria bacterium]|nr:UbiA family prenyltransferase [Candidatus Kapabacteria bacterium]